jgi:hypothetical protein
MPFLWTYIMGPGTFFVVIIFMNLLTVVENEPLGNIEPVISQHGCPVEPQSKNIFFDSLLAFSSGTSKSGSFHVQEDTKEKGKPIQVYDDSSSLPHLLVQMYEQSLLLGNCHSFLHSSGKESDRGCYDNLSGLSGVDKKVDSEQGNINGWLPMPKESEESSPLDLKNNDNATSVLEENKEIVDTSLLRRQLIILSNGISKASSNDIQALSSRISLQSLINNELSFPLSKHVYGDQFMRTGQGGLAAQKYDSVLNHLEALTSPVTGSKGQIDTGYHTVRYTILPEDMVKNIQIPLDTDLSFSCEAKAQCVKFMNKEQDYVPQAQQHSVPKDLQIKTYVPPSATAKTGGTDTGSLESYRFFFLKSSSLNPIEKIQFSLNTPPDKLITADVAPSIAEDLLQSRGLIKKEEDKKVSDSAHIETDNVYFSIGNKNCKADSLIKPLMFQESVKVDNITNKTFAIAKKGDALLEVSLKPEGLGKIDIELVLDKGVIHAHINTSEIVGKEIIEQNLNGILNSLINEGINIGSFSISLRNKQNEMNNNNREENLKTFQVMRAIQAPWTQPCNNVISIFV